MLFSRRVSQRDVLLAAILFAVRGRGYATPARLHKMITIAQEESGLRAFRVQPGRFGPVLAGLDEALEELRREGLIEVRTEPRESRYGYNYVKKITLTRRGEEEAEKAVKRLMGKLGGGWLVGTLEAWGKADFRELIFYVYDKYPQYTVKSEIREDVRKRRFR